MYIKLTVILILIFTSADAQWFKGHIYYTDKDSSKVEICAPRMLNGDLDKSFFSMLVLIKNEHGKTRLNAQQIKGFTFNDNGLYKFVTLDGKHFYEEVIYGKISFYYHYKSTTAAFPFLFKDNKRFFINVINPKKIVSRLIADQPDIQEKFTKASFSIGYLKMILQEYNSRYP